MKIKLSVAIITFNEEKNIEKCINSVLNIADEIVVVDSFSSDSTVEITKSMGAKVVSQSFLGHVGQKNFAITHCTHQYILSLDADEILSSQLRESIEKVKENCQYDGYELNRLTNYCGQWIKHCGWYPDKKLRLWNSKKGEWKGLNPHDEFIIENGNIGFLNGDLLHYSFYTIDQHKKQIELFSTISAQALYDKGEKGNFLNLLIKPFAKFIKAYIIKGGFLDGYYGFLISWYSAGAKFKKYYKLIKLWKSK